MNTDYRDTELKYRTLNAGRDVALQVIYIYNKCYFLNEYCFIGEASVGNSTRTIVETG